MNSERAQAYGRLMKTLRNLRGAKLHPHEEETVRAAADALFFCEDLDGDASAQHALSTFHELSDRLLERAHDPGDGAPADGSGRGLRPTHCGRLALAFGIGLLLA